MTSCISCGGPVEPLSPAMAAAKARLGLPPKAPKRCAPCVMKVLKELGATPRAKASDEPPASPEEER